MQIKRLYGRLNRIRLQQQKADYQTDQYRQHIYETATEVYRVVGDTDSALKYSELYSHLHDSLERTIADSRLEMSRIKLAALQNALTIKNLHKERKP
ncbi:MAG: hypothetical protein WKG06_22175 [Segetibacter sp.]